MNNSIIDNSFDRVIFQPIQSIFNSPISGALILLADSLHESALFHPSVRVVFLLYLYANAVINIL